MSQSARVTSIDALRSWKEALCVFQADAVESLGAVELEIRRTLDWLDQQVRYWQQEMRRREEVVLQAKNELARKKMLPIVGKNADTTEEEKNLRRARQRLHEAEERLARAQRLGPTLARAIDEYRSPARALGGMLDADVPNATALLDRKLDALDAYVAMGGGPPRPSGASRPGEEAVKTQEPSPEE